mmetsp:Transcript_9840/g.31574  ORF Transcript_9840/g.31574 Transcript_9840/m.31574 type:complete len:196 (+) Transcript_9840:3-590(+)
MILDELAAGTLPNETLAKYLIQDHRFLDSFSVLLASLIAAAPSLEDRIPGAKFLALILSEENTYFERAFESLGVDDARRRSTPDAPETTRFLELMDGASHSRKLHLMLAVLCVAEWSYQTWAKRVFPVPGLAFTHLEWIDLHRGDYFDSVVTYLRDMLDRLAPTLSESEKAETQVAFRDAVLAEKAFWAMARREP